MFECFLLAGVEKLTLLQAVHRVRRVFEGVNKVVGDVGQAVQRRRATELKAVCAIGRRPPPEASIASVTL